LLPVPEPTAERQPETLELVPLPEPTAERQPETEPVASGLVTIDFRNVDVRTVIDLVANVGGYDVIFTPEVRGKVTIRVVDGPWEEALQTILDKRGLRATRHADLILVSPENWD
jgi:type IV pilus assembly protein PilQ